MIDAPPEENVGAGPAVVLAVLLTSFFNHRWTQIPEFAFAFISVRSRFKIQ